MEHRTAGTLHSPSKPRRGPLGSLNSNQAPLKVSDLPKRQQKRAPVNSPPAKPIQKRPSTRPTPEKISAARAGGICQDNITKNDQNISLTELRNKNWRASDSSPLPSACRPILTAIYHSTNGDLTLLKSAMDWLMKNVAVARATFLQASVSEATSVVSNIEAWLQHCLNEKYSSKGGRLPKEMDEALQVLSSAILFNPVSMNIEQVKRLVPSLGGRQRLNRTKAMNLRMIQEDRPFSYHERKVRKDAFWPLLCLFVRRKICWNDKYTKVDTNCSRKIKCKEPIVETLEGGGFQVTGWKTIEREMRMWYEETTLADVLNLVVKSEEWKQLREEYPFITVGKNSLRLALCPSVRKPSFRSCVNEKMSALSYIMEDLYRVLNNNETLRKRIEECPCLRHRTARDMTALGETPPKLWHNEMRCLPSRFCGMATCEKKEQQYLRVGDDEPPKLRDKCCTKSDCANCGFAIKMGLGAPDCTAFTECDELMEVTLWEKAARNGDRFQREPTRHTGADRKTVAEVYDILVKDVAPVALEHLGEAQWWHTHVERKVATLGTTELLIYTDFSATPELIAKEVGNCHEAEHCVIDVLVVLDDPRDVEVIKDGESTMKRIYSCTYWAFLGPTDGKGKKNDHRFHREALDSVVAHHKKKALHRSVVIDSTTAFTDNCSGQYKSQYNMGDVAWFASKHPGIRLEHVYAPVFEFKGVHDGFGKTVKWKFKEAELKGRRIPNAKEGYGYLIENYAGYRSDWDALVEAKSPKLLQRGPFTMTEVRVGYVADSNVEAASVLEEFGGEHVLFCDRLSIPKTVGDKAAEGLTDIFSVRGKRESVLADGDHSIWELELATRVCFCSICTTRDDHDDACPYEALRDVRRITVDDKSSDNTWCEKQRAKQAVASYFRRKKMTGYINMNQLKDELNRIGKSFPINAKRMDLAHIFLAMQESTNETEQEQLLLALEDGVLNPEEPSLDDDFANDADSGSTQELPFSEEEALTDIDQLNMNDIDEERVGGQKNYEIADEELKLMPDFAALGDTILNLLLSQRRLSTAGSRAEKEERLAKTVRPF